MCRPQKWRVDFLLFGIVENGRFLEHRILLFCRRRFECQPPYLECAGLNKIQRITIIIQMTNWTRQTFSYFTWNITSIIITLFSDFLNNFFFPRSYKRNKFFTPTRTFPWKAHIAYGISSKEVLWTSSRTNAAGPALLCILQYKLIFSFKAKPAELLIDEN